MKLLKVVKKCTRPSVPCRTSIVRESFCCTAPSVPFFAKIGSDLVNAMSTISATQSKLHTWRKDEESEFASMFEEAVLLAEKIGVTREDMHASPRAVSQSRFRSNAGGTN